MPASLHVNHQLPGASDCRIDTSYLMRYITPGAICFGTQLEGSMGIMRIDLDWRLLQDKRRSVFISAAGWLFLRLSGRPLNSITAGGIKNIYTCAHHCFEKLYLIFFSMFSYGEHSTEACAAYDVNAISSRPVRMLWKWRHQRCSFAPPRVASSVKTLKSSRILRRSQHTTVSGKGGCSSGQQQAVPLVRDVRGLRNVFTVQEDLRK